MSPRERRLLPIIATVFLALAAYWVGTRESTAQPGAGSPELENFRSSEQIGIDVSVPFPVDI